MLSGYSLTLQRLSDPLVPHLVVAFVTCGRRATMQPQMQMFELSLCRDKFIQYVDFLSDHIRLVETLPTNFADVKSDKHACL